VAVSFVKSRGLRGRWDWGAIAASANMSTPLRGALPTVDGRSATQPPEIALWADVESSSLQRLLLAALESFAELGYFGTTTREIAKRAQMSPAGIYSHYTSKADLLYEIIRAAHVFMRERMLTAFAQSATPTKRLANLVATHVEVHAELRRSARVANYELHALPDNRRSEIVALRREMHGVMREAIRLGMEARDFYVEDLEATTVAVLSLGIDVSRWFEIGKRLTPEELGAIYARLVLRTVCAKSEP